jgi:adenosine kinase
MRIVVTGSLAYDYIMNFPGYFQEHILPEKAHIISVSFLVDSLRRMRGGVAGNIAYNLALLGERPLLVGAVGQDFGEYAARMRDIGVDISGLRTIEDEFTASCFINTDQANNQIVAFYTGAMTHSREISMHDMGLTSNDLVLISASDPVSMERIARECQEAGIPYVFDAGKQTPRLEPEAISMMLKGARVLLGNDYEFAMMAKKLDLSEEELIASAPITVITHGSQGSKIYSSSPERQEVHIPIVNVTDVRDPTGAGDAYVAGLVFGIARNLPLATCGRIAALAAAYAIEEQGCQEHSYTPEVFAARYEAAFGAESLTGVFANHQPTA